MTTDGKKPDSEDGEDGFVEFLRRLWGALWPLALGAVIGLLLMGPPK